MRPNLQFLLPTLFLLSLLSYVQASAKFEECVLLKNSTLQDDAEFAQLKSQYEGCAAAEECTSSTFPVSMGDVEVFVKVTCENAMTAGTTHTPEQEARVSIHLRWGIPTVFVVVGVAFIVLCCCIKRG